MGLTTFRGPTIGLGYDGQFADIPLDHESIMGWLYGAAGKPTGAKGDFPTLRKDMILRGVQTLHDMLGDAAKFPYLPSPLNLIRDGPAAKKRPETIQEAHDLLAPIHEQHVGTAKNQSEYPYFNFMPTVDAYLTPGGPTVGPYKTPCFSSVTSKAYFLNSTHLAVDVTTAGKSWDPFCVDSMWILGGSIAFGEIKKTGTTTFKLDLSSLDESKMWLVNNRGVLVTRCVQGFITAIGDLISTVTLLIGFAEADVKGATFKANTDFYQRYVHFNQSRMGVTPKLRVQDATTLVAAEIDPSYINSGDIFMIVRPDGLDPMIAWAEGGSVGHTTIAMRAANGTLYVCESTTHDAYWPTNGIQCHTWEEWWRLANKAQYNVVLLPMNKTQQESFDVQKAWDFFYETEGLNYGYLVLLSGWLDMKEGDQNSPCVPPDFKRCLNREIMNYVLLFIDDLLGNSPDNMVRQMLLQRIGKWTPSAAETWTYAMAIQYGQQNLGLNTLSDIYSIVEKDTWVYNTTRYGKHVVGRSQVCNVFVCNMLKHGGIFKGIDDEIECGESNLWTLYSSNIWDKTKMGENRPQICKTADPTNELCQLMGNWTVHLHPDLNSRPIYANMSNHCPSIGPNYYYPEGC